MKRMYMTITDKGGTGKTLFARYLAHHAIANKLKPLLVDGDGEVGGLNQFYQKSETVRFTGTEKDRELLMDIIDTDRETIIVDLPAASVTAMNIFNKEVNFLDQAKAEGFEIVFINIITPFKTSLRTVGKMIEVGGENAKYVVAVNRFYGDNDDFYLWFGDENQPEHENRKKLIEVGGTEIDFVKISTGVLVALDQENMKFADGVEQLRRRAHRQRVHNWLRDMKIEVEKIGL